MVRVRYFLVTMRESHRVIGRDPGVLGIKIGIETGTETGKGTGTGTEVRIGIGIGIGSGIKNVPGETETVIEIGTEIESGRKIVTTVGTTTETVIVIAIATATGIGIVTENAIGTGTGSVTTALRRGALSKRRLVPSASAARLPPC